MRLLVGYLAGARCRDRPMLACGLAAALALAGCGHGARPASPARAEVDAIAKDALAHGAVGLSVVVLRGDEVVHARGYGLADVEHGIPATERTVYPLASLSKQFWAAGVAQLCEQGRLDPESALADVLHRFPDRRVTVHEVLDHTSGLGDDDDQEDDTAFSDHPALAFAPGTWWLYSNRGAILVRRVVEEVSGQAWPAYLEDRIARPLGLASATTCAADGRNFTPLYSRGDRGIVRAGLPATTMRRVAFVCADALDAARFEHAFDTGTLLTPATVARMRTRTTIEAGGTALSLGYGWATRIGEVDGHVAFGHSGGFPGVSVAAYTFPADRLTIAVLMNATPSPGDEAYELVARIARAELRLPIPTVGDTPPPSDTLAAVSGSYDLGRGATARVEARDGRGWLVIDRPPWSGPLVWAGGRRFLGGPGGTEPDSPAVFVPATGPVRAVALGHRLVLFRLLRRIDEGQPAAR